MYVYTYMGSVQLGGSRVFNVFQTREYIKDDDIKQLIDPEQRYSVTHGCTYPEHAFLIVFLKKLIRNPRRRQEH